MIQMILGYQISKITTNMLPEQLAIDIITIDNMDSGRDLDCPQSYGNMIQMYHRPTYSHHV